MIKIPYTIIKEVIQSDCTSIVIYFYLMDKESANIDSLHSDIGLMKSVTSCGVNRLSDKLVGFKDVKYNKYRTIYYKKWITTMEKKGVVYISKDFINIIFQNINDRDYRTTLKYYITKCYFNQRYGLNGETLIDIVNEFTGLEGKYAIYSKYLDIMKQYNV